MIHRNFAFVAFVLLALAAAMAPAVPAAPKPVPKQVPKPAPARPKPAPAAPAATRDQILLRINEERSRAGAPPLAPSDVLHKMAKSRADAIAGRGALPTEAESMALFNRLQQELIKAGYLAQGWTESVTISAGGAADVVDYWKQDPSFREAMRHDYQDVGVGVSEFAGIPLYTFLFAWPKSEYYARQTAPLKDLQAVRESMLAQVNARRKAAGRPPVSLDPRLNEAAQKHAEDMLARTFYSHETPEGVKAWDRVRAAGYVPDIVGENIAAGHTEVAEVMDAWMYSPGHRRNILDVRLRDIGIGVAVGSHDHRYQILWVQDFATLERTP